MASNRSRHGRVLSSRVAGTLRVPATFQAMNGYVRTNNGLPATE